MNRIKVLIVAGDMGLGGLENQLVYMLRNADINKFQIDFTTTISNPYYQYEIESLGGRCIHINPTENGYNFFGYCKELYRIIKFGHYDVVHSHELFHSGVVLFIAKICGVEKRLSHAHSSNQGKSKSFIKRCYQSFMRFLIKSCATGYLACSTVAATFLYGNRILNNPKYCLVLNGVDTKRFLAELSPDENNEFKTGGWQNIIQVGRTSVEKNHLFTCEIAKHFKDKGKRIRFICVGNDGSDYEFLIKQKIEQYAINDNMILLGERNDVDVLMKKTDAFILPSQYEGMPLSLIEAQSSGLRCVVSDRFSHEVDFNIGAIKWLNLEDGVETWASALEDAISNERCNKDDIIFAINKYGFDAKNFADKLYRIYKGEEI